jgi:hypothetical protein
MPEFALASAVTSVLSRATRRVVDAPEAHIRGRQGRGVMPRGRNMSVLRVIRPAAFVRIRLRTSAVSYVRGGKGEVWRGGGMGDTHTTAVDVG